MVILSVGQLTSDDDHSFGLGGTAQCRVESRQRQSAPQREFQVRRIVQSQAMALRNSERGSPRLPVRFGIDADRQEGQIRQGRVSKGGVVAAAPDIKTRFRTISPARKTSAFPMGIKTLP